MPPQTGFVKITSLLLIAVLGGWGLLTWHAVETFEQFLLENKQLKQSLTLLSEDDQIGYAKVLGREEQDGQPLTTLVFYQTDRDNSDRQIFSREFQIKGGVAFFEAMIVKFDTAMVLDGQERAIYFWRRLYDEHTPPKQGQTIEEIGEIPVRYRSLLDEPTLWDRILLKQDHGSRFWNALWDLSNDPDRLKRYGISASYGNAVSMRLDPGLIYRFKLSNTGQIYPEVVKDL